MRVTQNMLTNNMLRNLSSSYNSLGKYMDQLSTGKKINRPSDDPVVAMKGMDYRTQVNQLEQFERNIGEVHNWMDNTDSALDKTQKALERLRELAVQGANGTYEEGQRGNIASEVDQLKEHLLEIANTKVNNKYIFSGTQTTGDGGNKPFTINDNFSPGDDEFFNFAGNNNEVLIEVSSGSKIKVNTSSNEIFTEKLFEDLTNFAKELREGDDDEAIGNYISLIDDHIDNNVNARADLGARQNRIDLIENRVEEQTVAAKDMMSKNEDADMEKVIMNLTSQEAVHRAALSAGARIIQPTLLDFLR
ncbi:flagellar hook-associated protein 3 FlgL [Gracilibacillus ureilyticus]|uniref:Flagellar hook-associated protein 3 FlgL n=1 Tax=Gracilibacillus ureilyticus TaxID=531814 RepID=A0A1H9NY00_9BACI|nr:flagellar hook-associated protein FlgL [Gracilibacillus ureilyticus]SER40812.1 flagellar hook-associated protein 3 FlgL [Gracilibacillus ureilyticus]